MPILHAEIRARPRAELLEALARVGIPCGEVLGVYDALTSTRSAEGGLVRRMAHPDAGTTDVMAPPHRIDGERLPVRLAPPQLGADGEAIVDRFNRAAHAILDGEMRTKLGENGMEVALGTPEELKETIAREIRLDAELVRAAGLVPQ